MVVRTAEQPGMGHGCAAAAMKKAAAGEWAACGERPCAAAHVKTSDFFYGDTEVECGRALKAASGIRVRGVQRDGRLHPIITDLKKVGTNPIREKIGFERSTMRNRCKFGWANELLIKYDVCSCGTRIVLIKQVFRST